MILETTTAEILKDGEPVETIPARLLHTYQWPNQWQVYYDGRWYNIVKRATKCLYFAYKRKKTDVRINGL